MTSTTGNNGRLGNQIIRNLAVSLIAEKFNLKVDYFNEHLINKLGINLFSGSNTYNRIEKLTDDNYFTIYNYDNLNFDLNPNQSYFQTKEITNFLYNYIHTIKSTIIEKNPFNKRYNNNNDLFIHIRLGDVRNKNPGINYYVNTINTIDTIDQLYISTDEKNHTIVLRLLKLYPNAKIINSDEITTFQYASTCKNIILSHGSFSALIGYLSFFSNVYYPEYELNKIWYGDMFSINNWIKMCVSRQ
jgi:hypothetical protein